MVFTLLAKYVLYTSFKSNIYNEYFTDGMEDNKDNGMHIMNIGSLFYGEQNMQLKREEMTTTPSSTLSEKLYKGEWTADKTTDPIKTLHFIIFGFG